jgi:hypothetical protein
MNVVAMSVESILLVKALFYKSKKILRAWFHSLRKGVSISYGGSFYYAVIVVRPLLSLKL